MSKEELEKVKKLNESKGETMNELVSEEKLDSKEQENIEGGRKSDDKEEAGCNFCSPII